MYKIHMIHKSIIRTKIQKFTNVEIRTSFCAKDQFYLKEISNILQANKQLKLQKKSQRGH
uniref:Uncharacterized protein n=1 Tax=Physcomitrium patens TaxID=3218 RepID=A0A2K1IRC1_PHYPA|nr:hypothetical protein PHYPA_025940 [Physcomitrium patens]